MSPSIDWWVMHGDGPPVGPVSTALLIQGIQAGKVPRDSLVCEVGGTEWRRLVSIPDLAEAFTPRPRRRFDPESERTQFDDAPLPPEEEEERSSRPTNTEVTVVEGLR